MDSSISIIVCCTLQGSNPSLRAVHLGWELADLSKSCMEASDDMTLLHCYIDLLAERGLLRRCGATSTSWPQFKVHQNSPRFVDIGQVVLHVVLASQWYIMIHPKSWKSNSLLVLQELMILTWPLTTGISSDSVTSRSRKLCANSDQTATPLQSPMASLQPAKQTGACHV